MPRPTTKTDLLALSDLNFGKLLAFIETVPIEMREKEFPLNERDSTIADVLCHLHEWHLMLERWHAEGARGGMPAIPGEGYTWKTLPAMNREIWRKYRGTSLDESLRLLKRSHETMAALIKVRSDDELFTKSLYPWTKSTSLGAYFVSATSSHYDWALKTLKIIKRHIAENGK